VTKWHSLKVKETLKQLKTSPKGLSESDAKGRYAEYGDNEVVVTREVSLLKIFAKQFLSFLVVILIAATIVLYIIGFSGQDQTKIIDASLIAVIVVLNGVFGFIQDYKAEKSIEALRAMSPLKALVIRDGEEKEIDARLLVPGDVILLEEGKKVPADARLLESIDLELDESLLTGESSGVAKNIKSLPEDTILPDRKNMVFMNTVVARGRGKAVIAGTGMQTEVGKIATQIEETEERQTPFQTEVDTLGKKIGLGILAIIALVASIQFIIGALGLIDIIIVAIALAVAAIPEGLPAVVTLSLALGSRRMARRKALVRELPVVESLGSVDVICTDKTGTITEDVMTVKSAYFDGAAYEVEGSGYEEKGRFLLDGKVVEGPKELLKCGVLCNNAQVGAESEKHFGDPTEVALLVSASKAGLLKRDLEKEHRRVKELPFSSERKMMTTIHRDGDGFIAYTKGAPEIVLDHCDYYLRGGKKVKLTKSKRDEMEEVLNDMYEKALRVLAFAYKQTDSKNGKGIEEHLVFLGFQGMIDPPRNGVRRAISECRKAGIQVIMITGDNALTAKAVAGEVGLGTKAMTGAELNKLSEKELETAVERFDIFARVTPKHKVAILTALQRNGHVVAMTGDGVNDAPALKGADVSLAMGLRGSDVARETADMILLDDNFATIVNAIEEGRTIFNNIRKFVNYLLTCNVAEVFVVFFASLLGYLPVTAVQLLWVNLITDGGPALALGIDPSPKGLMKQKPRKKGEGVINKRLTYLVGLIGAKKTGFILLIFFLGLSQGLAVAQTMAFTAFILYEFVRIAVIRSLESLTFFSNKWLVLALTISVVLQLVIIYSPLNTIFEVVPLDFTAWAILLAGIAGGWVSGLAISKLVVKLTPKDTG